MEWAWSGREVEDDVTVARTRATRRRRTTRALLAATAVALGVTAAACEPPPPPHCPTSPPDGVTSTVYNSVNASRRAAGLGELFWNGRLACLASEWSAYMAGNGAMSHRDLNATIRSPGFESYTGLAENVYQGNVPANGAAMHGAWMNSPSHRANILGPYDSIGVGYAIAGNRVFATENFGRH